MSAYSIREVVDLFHPHYRADPKGYLMSLKHLMAKRLAEKFMQEFGATSELKRDPETGEWRLQFDCEIVEWNNLARRIDEAKKLSKETGYKLGLQAAAESIPYGLAEGLDERYQLNEWGEYT